VFARIRPELLHTRWAGSRSLSAAARSVLPTATRSRSERQKSCALARWTKTFDQCFYRHRKKDKSGIRARLKKRGVKKSKRNTLLHRKLLLSQHCRFKIIQ